MTYRVAGWSTGGVGRLAIRAITRRPDLELAGVWVHNAEKEGVDAGMVATTMRLVNAIPYVCDAPAGLTTSLDLPLTTPRFALP